MRLRIDVDSQTELVRRCCREMRNIRLEIKLARKPSLNQVFRNARIERGLSVSEVAARVGVSAPCVYFWEMGRTRPRDANLTMLCKTLKLPIRATRELAAA